MTGKLHTQIKECGIPGLRMVVSSSNGYLIVENGKSLLIDCPDVEIPLIGHSVENPEIILHTHIQEEHCREWQAFPDAVVYVPADTADIALRLPRFFEECHTVWGTGREWDTRGEEKYGIAGCVTERPPGAPLNVCGELVPGEVFEWRGNHFEIIALPGHGKPSSDCSGVNMKFYSPAICCVKAVFWLICMIRNALTTLSQATNNSVNRCSRFCKYLPS